MFYTYTIGLNLTSVEYLENIWRSVYRAKEVQRPARSVDLLLFCVWPLKKPTEATLFHHKAASSVPNILLTVRIHSLMESPPHMNLTIWLKKLETCLIREHGVSLPQFNIFLLRRVAVTNATVPLTVPL